jgi:hypothetical protein
LRFTATGAPPAARRIRIFADESVCLLADKVWIERKLFNFMDRFTALCFTARSAVRAWEFVYDLSAVGGIYRLY